MAKRSPDQRNDDYLIAAIRAGIHKPILAALYAVQKHPPLSDGETGLGIAPANRIPPADVKTFPDQVKYAANTLRSLTDRLTAEGWQGKEFWQAGQGRYSDRFLRRVAEGYAPPATDAQAARLEPSDATELIQAYLQDWDVDRQAHQLTQILDPLDKALLGFVEGISAEYDRLTHQRQALLEAVRIWRKLDDHTAVVTALDIATTDADADEAALDRALLDFVQQLDLYFSGYPHQREGLLRLVQLWYCLASREAAIQRLLDSPAESLPESIDPALVAFLRRLPEGYRGQGEQRFALTEGYRLWHELESRTAAIADLGFDPQTLVDQTGEPTKMAQAAAHIDRALLSFWTTVAGQYAGTSHQRDVLIQLVLAWRRLSDTATVRQSLLADVRQMERAHRGSVDAMPAPRPVLAPKRPQHWTPSTLQLGAAIASSGSFTWADATQGGLQIPVDQASVNAIERVAPLLQEACDRIGRPFAIVRWYIRQPETRSAALARERHGIGDAVLIYCQGLTGQQLYWSLTPWWPGGLGHYAKYPYLCYLDARGYQTRWVQSPGVFSVAPGLP